MSAPDPIGELVLLARSAADAGVEWRGRLRRDWIPRTVAAVPPELLASALAEWFDQAQPGDADVAGQLEAAVLGAMAEQGYD
jgi:hypothetical protein